MPLVIFLSVLLLPALEIAVFIEVGSTIGTWKTVAAILLTAAVGIALVRRQGLATLGRAQASLRRNVFPVREAFDGICLVMAGLLLLTPGFLTDGLGALLLVPVFRNALRHFLLGRVEARGPAAGADGTIDGEYRVVEDENTDENRTPPDRIEKPD